MYSRNVLPNGAAVDHRLQFTCFHFIWNFVRKNKTRPDENNAQRYSQGACTTRTNNQTHMPKKKAPLVRNDSE